MRAGKSLSVSSADIRRLKALVHDRNAPQKHVWRAKIVLLTADGVGTNAIMRQTGTSKTCVWRWQDRFIEEGFEGLLHDKTSLADQTAGRRGRRARRRANAWRTAERNDPLDRRLDGQGGGAQCEFGSTHLAQAWPPAAPDAPVQALQRSAFRR
jgi:Homeodomain-like domain